MIKALIIWAPLRTSWNRAQGWHRVRSDDVQNSTQTLSCHVLRDKLYWRLFSAPLTHFCCALHRAGDVEIQRQCRPACTHTLSLTHTHTHRLAALSTLTKPFLTVMFQSPLKQENAPFRSTSTIRPICRLPVVKSLIFNLIIISWLFGFVFIYRS